MSDIGQQPSDKQSGAPVEPLSQNGCLIALCLCCCFPAGLYFVWKHPTWTTTTKWIWTGVWLALVMIGGALDDDEENFGRGVDVALRSGPVDTDEPQFQTKDNAESSNRKLAQAEKDRRERSDRPEETRKRGVPEDGAKFSNGDKPTREDLIQACALAAFGCLLENNMPGRPSTPAQRAEYVAKAFGNISPESIHTYFLAAARQLGAEKYRHSRFLLALEPRKEIVTVEGRDGLVQRYGDETIFFFIYVPHRDRYALIAATIGDREFDCFGGVEL